jgi:hypothetical protein
MAKDGNPFRYTPGTHRVFFATYKLELIEPATWPTRVRPRTATVHCLEAIYNRRRRHSAIDMLSPVDCEERYWDRRAAA